MVTFRSNQLPASAAHHSYSMILFSLIGVLSMLLSFGKFQRLLVIVIYFNLLNTMKRWYYRTLLVNWSSMALEWYIRPTGLS